MGEVISVSFMLSMFSGSFTVNRVEELSAIAVPVPSETRTYLPLSHYDAVNNIIKSVSHLGYQVIEENYGLSSDGQRLFGVLKLDSGVNDYTYAIGLRNSYDKSLSYAIAAGFQVFVCENLCFSGDRIVFRKHNHQLRPVQAVNEALVNLPSRYNALHDRIEFLKTENLSGDSAARLLVRMAEGGVINSNDIIPIWKEYQSPHHEEFAVPTKFALLMATTERLKGWRSPNRLDESHRLLGQFFNL